MPRNAPTRSRPAAPARRKNNARRPEKGSSRARSDLVVVGDAQHAAGVCQALERLNAEIHHLPDLGSALERKPTAALAHVLVSPLPEATLPAAVAELREHGPVFVVVPDDFSNQRARRLYDEGVHAVFEWPAEALLLPRMIRGRLGVPSRPARRKDGGDQALARAIRTRIELGHPTLPTVEVEVDDGAVEVSGRTDSVWKKQHLQQTIEQVPGVQAVQVEGLRVVPPRRPDEDILRDVEGVITATLGENPAAVSFAVDGGAVVLAGNLPRREEVDRLLAFVGNVRGVKAIRNLLTVAPAASRRDRGLKRRLVTALERLYPDCEVEVTCFGPVAVVSGRVARLSTKREIEQLLDNQAGIDRVVDKIDVRLQ